MRKVSLKDLKEDLPKWTLLAHNGEVIEITKYNEPFALLTPHRSTGLSIGAAVGKRTLEGVIKEGSQGHFLDILKDDRDAS